MVDGLKPSGDSRQAAEDIDEDVERAVMIVMDFTLGCGSRRGAGDIDGGGGRPGFQKLSPNARTLAHSGLGT